MKTNKEILNHFEDNCSAERIKETLTEHGYRDINIKSLKTILARLRKTEIKLKKRKQDMPKLQAFYQAQFNLPEARPEVQKNESKDNEKKATSLTPCFNCNSLKTQSEEKSTELNQKIKTLEHDQKEYTRKILHSEEKYKKLNNEVKKIEFKHKEVKNKLLAYQPKRINEMLKRKNHRISVLMKRVKSLRKSVNDHKSKRKNTLEVNKVKHQQHSNASYWKHKIAHLKSQLDHLKEKNAHLEFENSKLDPNKTNKDETTPIVTKKGTKTYGSNIRKCIYHCLQRQVPVEHAGDVISFIVREMTGRELLDVPSRSSIVRMGREMGVIADLQGAETLLSNANNTLSWDGTSLKGKHLNEIHVCTGKENIVLGVSNLAGGNTKDYTDDIVNTVDNLMSDYGTYRLLDKTETISKGKENISCTLTDRVRVNHCVVRELEKDFGKGLVELNCNVHPLDGMANKAKQVLKAREKKEPTIDGKLFGKEALAVKIILAVSKLKHKEGSGDPSSFQSFMKLKGISPDLLPRFVGNRFHILFKLAGSVLYLVDPLLEYLEKWCPAAKLSHALLSDLSTDEAKLQLQAIGIFGKVLTGPWMTHIYGNEENLHHLDMRLLFRKVLQSLHQYKEEPTSILTDSVDVFGKPLNTADAVLVSLYSQPNDMPKFCEIIASLSEGFIEVLKRQLHAYLEGNLSNPTEQMMIQTASAPSHNMHAERTLAMADSNYRRGPNSKIDFVSSKVKFKMNKSLGWLQKQGDDQSLMKHVIKKANDMIRKRKHDEQELENTKIKRMKERFQKRDTKERNIAQRKIKRMSLNKLEEKDIREINSSISEGQIQMLMKFNNNAKDFKDQQLCHTWYNDELGDNQEYEGKIKKISRNDKQITIEYDGQQDDNDDNCYDFSKAELMTDIILGDLVFL